MKKHNKIKLAIFLMAFVLLVSSLIEISQEELIEENVWEVECSDDCAIEEVVYEEVIWTWVEDEEWVEWEVETGDETYWGMWYLITSPTFSLLEEPQVENLTYNIIELNIKAVNQAEKYFKGINLTDIGISYMEDNWGYSYYFDNEKTIFIGMVGIENNPDLYNLILTHEYTHYILYRMNLTEDNLHEAIAELYTIFLNKETHLRTWGQNNEVRVFPYDIFVDQIIEKDNFDCLDNVFDEDNKIGNIDEILSRLDKFCDIQYEEDYI